jgi:hypothetical protein
MFVSPLDAAINRLHPNLAKLADDAVMNLPRSCRYSSNSWCVLNFCGFSLVALHPLLSPGAAALWWCVRLGTAAEVGASAGIIIVGGLFGGLSSSSPVKNLC